jgi:hypothetical protein
VIKQITSKLAALALLLGGVGQARADFITYTLTTTASGTINGMVETNVPLTLTVTYDTSTITGSPTFAMADNQSVTVSFGGTTDTITTATTTGAGIHDQFWIASGSGPLTGGTGLLELSPAGAIGNSILFSLPSDPFFGPGFTDGTTYTTTDGSVVLTDVGTVTYALEPEATATPEPSTLTLLGIGAVFSLGYGWRRRRKLAIV